MPCRATVSKDCKISHCRDFHLGNLRGRIVALELGTIGELPDVDW